MLSSTTAATITTRDMDVQTPSWRAKTPSREVVVRAAAVAVVTGTKLRSNCRYGSELLNVLGEPKGRWLRSK